MFLTETTKTNRKTPLAHNDPGLEGCSRDPGFDQNTVRDSGEVYG